MKHCFFKRFFSFFLFFLTLVEPSEASVDVWLPKDLTDAPAAGQTVEEWWVNNIWPSLQTMSWYNNMALTPKLASIESLKAFADTPFFNKTASIGEAPTVPGLPDDYLDNDFGSKYPDITSLADFAKHGPIRLHNNEWYLDKRFGFELVLSTMDMVRQRPYAHSLFQQGNLQTNDLQKVVQLSGVFCKADTDGLTPIFSGMIEPGQNIGEAVRTIKVLTCFHGFWNEQLDNIYFVPFKRPIDKNHAFKVKHIIISRNVKVLHQSEIDEQSRVWNSDSWEELFNEEDYVEAYVERVNKDRGDLGQVLHDRNLLDGSDNVLNLGPLRGAVPQNIFTFGRPGYAWLGDPSMLMRGYTLTTNVENMTQELFTPYLCSPSHRGPVGNISLNPQAATKTQLDSKKAISCPAVTGMSGGPVVACEFEGNDIRCQLVGVIHGVNLSERTASDKHPTTKVLVAHK